MIGGTYVVGDVHGRFDEWIQMKNRIEAEDPEAKFIFVGDLEDRGPKSCEMIRWAIENITEDGKYQTIKGNHEEGKISWWNHTVECAKYDKLDINDFCYVYDFLGEHYGFHEYMWEGGVTASEMHKIIKWMDNLPYYKDIQIDGKRFLIAHADMPEYVFDENKKVKEELPQLWKFDIIWNREAYEFNLGDEIILIHGHTPSVFPEAYPFFYRMEEKDFGKIVKMKNRYNVDCGAGYIGYLFGANLAILRLNDFKEYYLYNEEEISCRPLIK